MDNFGVPEGRESNDNDEMSCSDWEMVVYLTLLASEIDDPVPVEDPVEAAIKA